MTKKSALLIIDVQNGFLDAYNDKANFQDTFQIIHYVSQMMRNAGQLVIHVRDVEDADSMTENELAITSAVDIHPDDLHVEKVFSNAFCETELKKILNDRGIELLILCGQAAEHCVVFTYNGAIEQGFTPTVLQDGVLSAKAGRVDALMQDRNVISHAAIRMLIGN